MSGRVSFSIDGEEVTTDAGVTIGSVLHARQAALRTSPGRRTPRGLYCGMGICFECAVTVDGQMVRACITAVRDGMRVEAVR